MAGLRVRSMLGIAAASVGSSLVNGFSNTILPLILDGFGLPHVVIGLLAQERSIAGLVVQPLVGAISDRLETPLGRRRPFFLVGIPLASLVLVAIATGPSVPILVAIIPLLGLSMAVAMDPYNALLVDVVAPEERGPVGGVMTVAATAGQIVLLLSAFRLYEHQRPWLFAIIIAGLVIGFAITFVSVREPRRQERPAERARWRPAAYLRGVLAEREVAKYIAALFFYFLGLGAATPFLTQFAVHVLHVTSAVSFLLVFAAVIATGVMAIPAGLLSQRFGKQRTLSAGLFAYAATALIGSQTQTAGEGLAVMVVLGIFGAFPGTLIGPLLADLIPRNRAGEFIGLGSMVWSVATPVGAAAAGAFIDLSGTYRTVFVMAGILYFVAWTLLRTVRAPATVTTEPAWEPTPSLS